MVIRELMPTGNLKGRLGSQDRRPCSCAITVPLDRSALWQRFRSGLRRERQSWLAPPIPRCEILSDGGRCPLVALPRHAVIGQGVAESRTARFEERGGKADGHEHSISRQVRPKSVD